jgi:hypothetical protein
LCIENAKDGPARRKLKTMGDWRGKKEGAPENMQCSDKLYVTDLLLRNMHLLETTNIINIGQFSDLLSII